MSEVSKVVFVSFTQHCIQSTVTHVRGVKGYCTLSLMSEVSKVIVLCIQGPLPLYVFEPSARWV